MSNVTSLNLKTTDAEGEVAARAKALVTRAETCGLAPAVHTHCKTLFDKDIWSIDGAQMKQLEQTFGYFITILSGESVLNKTVH